MKHNILHYLCDLAVVIPKLYLNPTEQSPLCLVELVRHEQVFVQVMRSEKLEEVMQTFVHLHSRPEIQVQAQ